MDNTESALPQQPQAPEVPEMGAPIAVDNAPKSSGSLFSRAINAAVNKLRSFNNHNDQAQALPGDAPRLDEMSAPLDRGTPELGAGEAGSIQDVPSRVTAGTAAEINNPVNSFGPNVGPMVESRTATEPPTPSSSDSDKQAA